MQRNGWGTEKIWLIKLKWSCIICDLIQHKVREGSCWKKLHYFFGLMFRCSVAQSQMQRFKNATQHFYWPSWGRTHHSNLPHIMLQAKSALLPAGMVARQLLRTLTATSDTAAGVRRMSSHAREKTRIIYVRYRSEWEKNSSAMQYICSHKTIGAYVHCCWPWCPWRSERLTSWIPLQQESVPEARSWQADWRERAPEQQQEIWFKICDNN